MALKTPSKEDTDFGSTFGFRLGPKMDRKAVELARMVGTSVRFMFEVLLRAPPEAFSDRGCKGGAGGCRGRCRGGAAWSQGKPWPVTSMTKAMLLQAF